MSDLTRQLRDHPDAFLALLAAKPLVIALEGSDDAQANEPAALRAMSAAGDATIRGLDRVAWASIADDGDRHTVTVNTTSVALADTEPCYWLPWRQNATMRIKLKPSKKVGGVQDDAIAFDGYQFKNRHDPAVTAHALAQRGVLNAMDLARRDARLFFTAMLTGCSVHIEGEQTAPNVYHGNASAMGDSFAAMTTRKAFRNRLQAIDAHLHNQYQHLGNPGANNVRRLDARGYDFRMWGNAALAQKWHHGAELLPGALAGAEVRKIVAAVFGVRVGDNWQFHAQRVYQYKLGNNPIARLGMAPVQIWPGVGRVAI